MAPASYAVEETMVGGEQRELDAARGADLVEDVHQMPLDGVLADGKAASDFLVRVAVDDRADDVLFASRQTEHVRLPARRCEPPHAGGDVRRGLVADPVVAGHHALDALEQNVGARILRQDTARAELPGVRDVGHVDRPDEQNRADRHAVLAQLTQRVARRSGGRRRAEEQNVGLPLAHHGRGGGPDARLAHDLQIGIGLQQPSQAVAEDGIVVGNHDSHGRGFPQWIRHVGDVITFSSVARSSWSVYGLFIAAANPKSRYDEIAESCAYPLTTMARTPGSRPAS